MGHGYAELEFETQRLYLRAWRGSDAEEAFEIYGDPEVARYLTGVPEESIETQRQTLLKIIAAYSRLNRGMGSFPIFKKDSGHMVGAALLKPLPRTEDLDLWRAFRDNPAKLPPIHEIEIGWHLRRSEWGKGFATESAEVMLTYAFDTLQLEEVFAILYPENTASAAVTKRLGMRLLGPSDKFYGVTADLYVKP